MSSRRKPPPLIKRHSAYYVYMLECADGTYYTGYTNDVEARVRRHNAGNGSTYVRSKLPASLVYVKEYRYYKNAVRTERILKKLRHWQKEELVRSYAHGNMR